MGANRMQTTLRVVLPGGALRHRRRRRARHVPRVGETMIVALAAGAQKNLSIDPREGMQTMTGFIAQTAGGENAGRVDVLQHALRRRAAAVRDHPGHQHHQHRASSDASGRSTDELHRRHHRPRAPCSRPARRSRERSLGSLLFLGGLWFSLFFGVMVLVVLIVDTVIDGSRPPRRGPDHAYDSTLFPETHRLPGRHPRQRLADGHHRRAGGPARHRRGPLPGGVRGRRPAGTTASSRSTCRTSPRSRRSSTACWPWRSWP